MDGGGWYRAMVLLFDVSLSRVLLGFDVAYLIPHTYCISGSGYLTS